MISRIRKPQEGSRRERLRFDGVVCGAWLTTLLFSTACSESVSSPTGTATLEIVSARFNAQIPSNQPIIAEVFYRFTNMSNVDVFVPRCIVPVAPSVEVLIEGDWVAVWERAEDLCLEAPLRIPAGSTYDGEIEPELPSTGTFRLHWQVFTIYDHDVGPRGGVLAPKDWQFSAPFHLEEVTEDGSDGA